MKFNYQVEELPRGDEPYRIATDIEGRLSILTRKNEILLDADGILLVELAVFCKKWLDENAGEDFYYASMDFEEEPIIAFIIQQPDTCCFKSVWQKLHSVHVPLAEVKASMVNYIESLKNDLDKKFHIKIDGYEGL